MRFKVAVFWQEILISNFLNYFFALSRHKASANTPFLNWYKFFKVQQAFGNLYVWEFL